MSYLLIRSSNQFSNKVAEEYLKYYDFSNLDLVEAMRKFFTHFALTGESQERERVLLHFTRQYISCNPTKLSTEFQSEGTLARVRYPPHPPPPTHLQSAGVTFNLATVLAYHDC